MRARRGLRRADAEPTTSLDGGEEGVDDDLASLRFLTEEPAHRAPTAESTTTSGTADEPADTVPSWAQPDEPSDPMWDALSVAGVAMGVFARNASMVWCNTAFADLVAREPADLGSHRLFDILNAGPQDTFERELRRVFATGQLLPRHEVEAVDLHGTRRSLALSCAVTTAWDGTEHLLVVAEDLTRERQSARAAQGFILDEARSASQDALTGLPNRDSLETMLVSSLHRASRTAQPFTVLRCDLDDFGRINEVHGTAAGDEVIQWVAARLTHTLRHNDVLARIGSDEFVVIAESVPDEKIGNLVARRLISAVTDPINLAGQEIRIGMSVGFTLADGHERSLDILSEAELALQAAKRSAKGGAMSYTATLAAVPRRTSADDLNGMAEFSGFPAQIEMPAVAAAEREPEPTPAQESERELAPELAPEVSDELPPRPQGRHFRRDPEPAQ